MKKIFGSEDWKIFFLKKNVLNLLIALVTWWVTRAILIILLIIIQLINIIIKMINPNIVC
jgi:hypothetical protein